MSAPPDKLPADDVAFSLRCLENGPSAGLVRAEPCLVALPVSSLTVLD